MKFKAIRTCNDTKYNASIELNSFSISEVMVLASRWFNLIPVPDGIDIDYRVEAVR